MSATGLKVFDRTLHKTSQWLDEIMADMRWEDKRMAYHALRSVLHTLRDRHKDDFLAHVAEELPDASQEELERAVSTVFAVLSRHADAGELQDVRHQLPEEVRRLWH